MRVQQISIFLENKEGRLAKVTDVLGQNGINIRALSIADTTDFGILRLIVNKPQLAYQVLKDQGFTVSTTDVIAVEVSDQPGGLSSILRLLEKVGINIEYLYAFVTQTTTAALIVFRVEQVDEAIELLQANGVRIVPGDKVYQI
ncbi:ACT domain protein [Desulforamulus reducens MI-1]|uniref:ACT domain protein n=1 Tax=Desulforamulus reducens (strain ATCC BAA-1160 / DSM 100696 / MI-1) TaxID=349161 RepID=A4J8I4_DESRM|nr:ACT domain-containing protein [Desulforamulus reducens]ABO51387.1 ACT domain protein [Desulforamulus reducens MI-1]